MTLSISSRSRLSLKHGGDSLSNLNIPLIFPISRQNADMCSFKNLINIEWGFNMHLTLYLPWIGVDGYHAALRQIAGVSQDMHSSL